KRCEQLGLELYNFHPGSTVGAVTVAESIGYIAECIDRAHAETSSRRKHGAHLLFMAASWADGVDTVGGRGERDRWQVRRVDVDDKTQAKVCLDSCACSSFPFRFVLYEPASTSILFLGYGHEQQETHSRLS
ncbi:hypothetical protein OF83DRAFT_1060503, partial [Amylostereum chailletii]